MTHNSYSIDDSNEILADNWLYLTGRMLMNSIIPTDSAVRNYNEYRIVEKIHKLSNLNVLIRCILLQSLRYPYTMYSMLLDDNAAYLIYNGRVFLAGSEQPEPTPIEKIIDSILNLQKEININTKD